MEGNPCIGHPAPGLHLLFVLSLHLLFFFFFRPTFELWLCLLDLGRLIALVFPRSSRLLLPISSQESELEYNSEHVSQSIIVGLPLVGKHPLLEKYPDLQLLVWTTTPWTLVANQVWKVSSPSSSSSSRVSHFMMCC